MSKELYVYSMPESFMRDQSVPARWRILGIVNGFHINGLDFYASNAWLMEKLGCSQQTVSSAVSELEELDEITCERTKTSRVIRRKATNQLVPPYKPTRVYPTNQLVPNSYSNSKSLITAALADELRVVEFSDLEGELGDSKSPRISPDKKKAYDELIAWSEKERSFKFLKTHVKKQYRAFKMANDNGLSRDQLMERWEEMSTDKFWAKNGYDWMNVVTSFNTKPV